MCSHYVEKKHYLQHTILQQIHLHKFIFNTLHCTLNIHQKFSKMFCHFPLFLVLHLYLFAVSSSWRPYLFISFCIQSIHFFQGFLSPPFYLYCPFCHNFWDSTFFWGDRITSIFFCSITSTINCILHLHYVPCCIIPDTFHPRTPRRFSSIIHLFWHCMFIIQVSAPYSIILWMIVLYIILTCLYLLYSYS